MDSHVQKAAQEGNQILKLFGYQLIFCLFIVGESAFSLLPYLFGKWLIQLILFSALTFRTLQQKLLRRSAAPQRSHTQGP